MGALPGPGVLSGDPQPAGGASAGGRGWPPIPEWLGADQYRGLGRRTVVVRPLSVPLLVLGGSQDAAAVDAARAAQLGLELVRRRTGGGAVLADPGSSVWLDAWIPAGDPLAGDDVLAASAWVGGWWLAALASLGATGLHVHAGREVRGRWGDRVCFAGTGAGEVVRGPRKVVGVAQWRSREGALFQVTAYRRWEPSRLARALAVPPAGRAAAGRALRRVAAGLDEVLGAEGAGGPGVEEALLAHLPGGAGHPEWDVRRPGVGQPVAAEGRRP